MQPCIPRLARMKSLLRLCVAALVLTSPTLAPAQNEANRLTFDVAAIRLSRAPDRNGGIKALPGGNGYTAQNIPVKLMISLMYRVPMSQISGGPEWLDSERYNIEAKVDRSYSIDDLHVMFQNLLVDRFNLKFHIDIKEGPVYALTLDTPDSKMKVNDSPQDFRIPMNFDSDGVVGIRVPMPYFCWWLGQQLQSSKRPVINLTGLDKNYDFKLSFAPELPPDVSKETLSPELRDRPSLFDAVKQQLGLKLTPQRGPVEHYIIDHIDRPSDN
ncbi:MAG: hypothetical protein JWM43_1379 [Acidobacteriaceae bacterium]|nr:hypothetical protein [Acidobacteriaceae bacterium]